MKIRQSLQGRALPLQIVLVIPFILQVFGAVSLVGYLSFRNGQRAVNDLADQLMERNTETVSEHLSSYLSVPQKINQINADAIRLGILDLNDREAVGKYFWHQMQAYDLNYIGIGLARGGGIGAARYDGKTVTIDDWSAEKTDNLYTYGTDDQGNRTKVEAIWSYHNPDYSWYTEPVAAGKPIWAKIITDNLATGPYVSASASRPIYDAQNRLLGMSAIDIHLLKLSDFLRTAEVSELGHIFIVERDGALIATSSDEKPFKLVDDTIQRLYASESQDSVLRAIAQHFEDSNVLQSIDDHADFRLEIAGEPRFIHAASWRDPYGLDWVVVTSIPDSAFMDQIHRNTRITVMLCIGALGLASVLGLLTAQWIARPMQQLNQASEAMATGDLDQTVPTSRIRELNSLSNSFNRMAGQLRSSFTALEASKQDLENRVEERTSELKKTLEELQRTQAQVVQNEKMSSLGQLVAGVAHEINNPVNFIHGNLIHVQKSTEDLLEFVQLYQQHDPNPSPEIQAVAEGIDLDFLQEDLPKMLSSMKLGTDRIRQIILSLRNFSRIDEAEFKAVDIHEGIDSTLMILQHRLKAKTECPEVEIVRDYADLPLVECYAGQLNQVFMNILVNSVDALEEKNAQRTYQEILNQPSRITIRTALIDQDWIEVAIADNGMGIPVAVRQRIFDPFFTTKPQGKGTGMGMSISYQIITEKHGGKLECVSTTGEGTEFIIQIPLKQAVVTSLPG